MKRLSFCFVILVLLSFGIAFAQPPGNTFIRLGTVTPTVGKDSITAGVNVSFPLIYGNRDTNSYNCSNAFIIFSDADGVLEDGYYTHRGDGTATWAHAAANGGNVHGLTGLGIWADTTGLYHKTDFPGLYKFSTFGNDGAGADTIQWSGAGGIDDNTGLPTTAIRPLDSGVYITLKVLTRIADHGKFICIDSSSKYPPSGTWKWPAFNYQPAFNATPTWSGAKCFTIIDPNHPKNQPPVLNPIGSQTIDEGQNLTVIATATDPDGTIPSLSASPLPTGASFVDNGNGSGTFSWTPGFNQAGGYDVTFIASDGQAADTEIVHITVNNVNRAPVLDAIGPKTVAEAANLNFTVTGSDLDGTALTFSASPLPAGATFNTTTHVFDWTPTYDQAGPYNVLFVVSDGSLADSEMVTITVTNVNRAPVLAAIGAKNVQVGQTLNFNVSATDPDGTTPTLSATALANATFTDNGNGTGSFSFTPVAGQVGPQQVTFTASDGSLTADEIVTITVEPKGNFFVFSKDTLTYTATVGTNPATQSVNITKGGDTELEYNATTAAPWINLTNATASTPANLVVGINTTGLVVNPYHDSVQVSGAGASTKWIQVYLTITPCPAIKLAKTAYADTIFVGDHAVVSDSIDVTSTGAALNFEAQTSAGFAFPMASGTTPGKVSFVFNELFATAGSFQRCFTVVGNPTDQGIPCPSQAQVCVSVVVQEKPCVALKTSDTLLEFTAMQGDTIATPNARVFSVSSSDAERNFAFDVKAPVGNDWVFFDSTGGTAPFSGTTPAQVPVQIRPGTLGLGLHSVDIVVSTQNEEVCAPKLKVLTVHVTITRRPSADTVLVENKPAVPGQTVEVPVNFVNTCPLKYAELSLKFDATALHLSSVTYGGSKVGYVTNKSAEIDNGSGKVRLTIDVGAQSLVPDGFGNWATLQFVVRPEAALGVYPITKNLDIPDSLGGNPWFKRDCGSGVEDGFPEFVQGSIIVDQIPNSVCGYVVDTNGVQIPGATVQLYADFPNGTPEMTTTSSDIGSFFFQGVTSVPFDLYAFANGYYPGKLDNLNFEAKGVKIVLKALKNLNPTSQWVDYYCDENTYLKAPLPVGSVVEAYTPEPANLLVGRWVVTAAGKYGFMPVYRASSDFADDGALWKDNIRFFINGAQALANGDTKYPQDYAKVQVCLEYGQTITKTCTLQAGWNLVSWNVQTESQSILDVLGPYMNCIDVVLGFEQGGLTYDPTLPEFSTLWSTDHLSGYWIKVKDDCPVTLTLQGLPVPVSTPIAVTPGWNLVSYLPETTLPPVTALNSISTILLYAYGKGANGIEIYQPGSEFNQLNSMATCNGYWVKVSGAGTLIYPDASTAAFAVRPRTSTSPVQSLSSAGSYITPTWVNLYASGLKLDGRTIGAGSVIEAHSLTTNTLVGTFTLKSDGKFGFMPVYANADDNNAALVPGGQFYLTVDGTKTKGTFTWTSNGDRMQVASLSSGSGGLVPDGFSLEQNYPNPFNPTTTISFMVPVSTRARIEIYNVLGNLIAVPFDDAVEAGAHSIVWDGRNQNGESVSSGVYLYKLVSDRYSEARKMMLLK